MLLESPYVYFGGKSRIAKRAWSRLGSRDVVNYIEPFLGSAAMLLARPGWRPGLAWGETVNDYDGFISNFWRAVKADAEAVVEHADWPRSEADLHRRNSWLTGKRESLVSRLEGDDYYNAKIAGWWVWGMGCYLASGLCNGKGPWTRVEENGEWKLVKKERGESDGTGVGRSILKRMPNGIHKLDRRNSILQWIKALQSRLRYVCIANGDWSRVCTDVFIKNSGPGKTAVFLDPPYKLSVEGCENRTVTYGTDDENTDALAAAVCKWAIEHGDDPKMRIALCGYEGEHKMPRNWEEVNWTATGGYANQGEDENVNRTRERIWFSPHCLKGVTSQKTFGVRRKDASNTK